MSAHEHSDSHGHGGAPEVSLSEYMTGFVLSVILTAIPFWLVMGDVLESAGLTIFIVIALGAIQMIVHMVYFLHMNSKSEEGWLLLSMAFTIMLVVITIAGSLWIMLHLHDNTMPWM